jgi:hypothetical protein
MADTDLTLLPRDVQRLMKAAGIKRLPKYAGRLKSRPAQQSVTRVVTGTNGSTKIRTVSQQGPKSRAHK